MTRLALALLVLAVVVLWTSPAVANSTGSVSRAEPQGAGAGVMGDVDCSGVADSIDALQVLRSVASLPIAADCLAQAADVDCSAQVDSIDGLLILRFVASLPVNPPAGCTPIGDPLSPAPSSFGLIDEALAGGTIGEETALTYKVYAVFGDDALPPEYRGDDSGGPPDSFILSDVQLQFDTLSPEAQATLGPFLIPPAYKGSWASPQSPPGSAMIQAHAPGPVCSELDPNWLWHDAATANVRVWWQTQRYPEDEAKAQAIAGAMDATIWPALTNLMGEPLSDAGEFCNGGDGRLDMYLALQGDARSLTYSYRCNKTPAYIDLSRGVSTSVVAHEFMHTIQRAYEVKDGCQWLGNAEYNWLREATAVWAQDFVYPQGNEEHYIADWYMSQDWYEANPGKPLETANDRHEYGAYLFFLYLTKFYGTEQIVRTIWDNAAQYESLEAVEQALPGGFEERWAPFAACLWNKPPSDCFAQWDGLQRSAESFVAPKSVELDGQASRSLDVGADVEYLAVSYSRFAFSDDEIHSVVLDNTLAGFPHAAVQALVKIGGQWQGPLDWTNRATASFCRDVAEQHIEELVLIISNDDWKNEGELLVTPPPTLTGSTSGCTEFVGSASAVVNWDTLVFTVGVSGLRFQYEGTDGTVARYSLTESPGVTWHASGTIHRNEEEDCPASGEMTLQPADGSGDTGKVRGLLLTNLETQTYQAAISGIDFDADINWTCLSDGYTGTRLWPLVDILKTGVLSTNSNDWMEITGDGRLDGEYLDPGETYGGHWSWHFDPAPPPVE